MSLHAKRQAGEHESEVLLSVIPRRRAEVEIQRGIEQVMLI